MSYEDSQFQKDPTKSRAVEGYGMPSKGTYSPEYGGYKTFGTTGQGESNFGAKDYNDTTCGDRVILLSITALNDTTIGLNRSNMTNSTYGHPIVMQANDPRSYMSIEVGNFWFFDDVEPVFEESAVSMKSYWMIGSLLSLIALSMNLAN